MTPAIRAFSTTGLWGPVSIFGGALLLFAAPLMRGGNRYAALIPLEFLGLFILAVLWAGWLLAPRPADATPRPPPLLAALLLSPLLFAVLQLTPLPFALWKHLPGHAVYEQTLQLTGAPAGGWRALSVSPDATAASLLAAVPILAAFLLAYLGTRDQLRTLLRVVVAVAFGEVALGLLQVSGGQHSPLFFGVMTYGPPVGTFANRNHYANYIAMALAAYTWLGYESLHHARRGARAPRGSSTFGTGHATALWVSGGLVLVVGILMSRSRGAALFGLTMAVAALACAAFRINGRSRGWRFAVPVALLLIAAAAGMVGFDAVVSRISGAQLAGSASFRGELAGSSFEGALAFWPWGSGWGTYDLAFQRFLPASIPVYPNHAHQDYIEMLFEGGVIFVLLAAAFLWLAGRRAALLLRRARRDRTLDDDAMASLLCGLGLAGLLLHSLVEFNLRIPANAILGALLAGVYLRPLSVTRRARAGAPA